MSQTKYCPRILLPDVPEDVELVKRYCCNEWMALEENPFCDGQCWSCVPIDPESRYLFVAGTPTNFFYKH